MYYVHVMELRSEDKSWPIAYEVKRESGDSHKYKLIKRLSDPTEFHKVGEVQYFGPATLFKTKPAVIRQIFEVMELENK